jgi:hypothetical protein
MINSGGASAGVSPRLVASLTTGGTARDVPFASQTPAANVPCVNGERIYSRLQSCTRFTEQLTLFKNNTPEGTVTFTVTQWLHMSATSRDFAESVGISGVRVTGAGGGVHVALSVSCGSPCHAANHFPAGSLSNRSGSIAYHDSIAAHLIHSTASHYAFTFTKSGFSSARLTETSMTYRCDAAYGRFPGCVIPKFTPRVFTLASLPNVAVNIRTAQAGPGRYGVWGGGHPLHHITSAAAQARNYAAVCGRSVVGPPPAGKSCDDYPFKTTREGGAALTTANRHVAWVPTPEQVSVVNRLNTFYAANRLLNGDPFYVTV